MATNSNSDGGVTCYHIWKVAEGGDAMFRFHKCYQSRATANSTVRNWQRQAPDRGGRRPGNIWTRDPGQFLVLACRKSCPCPCRKGRGLTVGGRAG